MTALRLSTDPPSSRNLFADYFRAYFRALPLSLGLPLLGATIAFLMLMIPWVDPESLIAGAEMDGTATLFTVGAAVAVVLLYFVYAGALAHGLVGAARGEPASYAGTLRVGFHRIFVVLLVQVLFVLAVSAGSLLLVLPGILAGIRFSLALPVCVIEGHGPIASFRRSIELTRGFGGAIFGSRFVMSVAFVPVNLAVSQGAGKLPNELYAVALAVYLLQLTVEMVVPAVLYFRLRSAREGFGVEDVAETFS